jgi:hypothetical protein
MSSAFDLIKQISSGSSVLSRISHLEAIARKFPDLVLPLGFTTTSAVVPPSGSTLLLYIDSSIWTKVGHNLQVGSEVSGAFRGFYCKVTEVVSLESIRVEVLGLSNMAPTEVVPSDAEIHLGSINGVRSAFTECSNSFGWMKPRKDGAWVPAVATSQITAKFFVSDELVAQRTITATITNGSITTGATGTEGEVGVVVVSTGKVFTVRFTYQPSVGGAAINSVEKTLVAMDFSLEDGTDGSPGPVGVPGYARVTGVWSALKTYGGTTYQQLAYRGSSWYVTKNSLILLTGAQGPPDDNSTENDYWLKVPDYENIATGLLTTALDVGADGHYLKYALGKMEFSGKVIAQRGSVIPGRAVETDIPAPIILPKGGTYDSANVLMASTSHGAKVFYTTDGGDPSEASTRWIPNTLLYSEKHDESVWSKINGTTVETTTIPSPNPSVNAFKFIGGTELTAYQELLGVDVANMVSRNNQFTASIYVKASDPSITQVTISLAEYLGATFKTKTSRIYQVSTVDWTRIFVTHKLNQTPDNVDRLRLSLECPQSTVGGGEGLLTSMAQLELGEWPSAYVATVGTRGGVIPVASTTTIKARAYKLGEESFPVSEVYTINGTTGAGDKVSKPYESLISGAYPDYEYPLWLELFCNTAGANIYYTDDGSAPTASDFLYDENVGIEITDDTDITTIRAIAVKAGRLDSEILTVTYVPINYNY